MRNFIAAVASITAIAALAVPALASASVERYQTETATFTALQPRNAISQYDQVWKHDFKVTINPCDNTFTGNSVVTDAGVGGTNAPTWTESVTGSLGNGTVSFDSVPNAGATFHLVNAPFGVSTVADSTYQPNIIEFKVDKPTITGYSNYKNHGDYVSSQGGGSDAAHSCIGMPIH